MSLEELEAPWLSRGAEDLCERLHTGGAGGFLGREVARGAGGVSLTGYGVVWKRVRQHEKTPNKIVYVSM